MSSDFLTELSKIVLEIQNTKGNVSYNDLMYALSEAYPDKERYELHTLVREHMNDLVGVIEARRLIN